METQNPIQIKLAVVAHSTWSPTSARYIKAKIALSFYLENLNALKLINAFVVHDLQKREHLKITKPPIKDWYNMNTAVSLFLLTKKVFEK